MSGTPRRILMTADTVGGVWTYATELAGVLEQHGVEVALATMGTRLNRDQRRQARALGNVHVLESEFKLEWMQDPWDDVERAADWLLSIDRDFQPDLIHLNNYAHTTLKWSAPTVVVGHSCVLSWWQAVRKRPIDAEWKRYATEVTRSLQSADMVVGPSRAMLSQLKALYGPFPRTRVVYNARHPHHFTPGQKENIIFTAGRVRDEAKNISTLLKVAPDLDWPVCVAGQNNHPDKRTNKRESRMGANVRMLGCLGQTEVADWLGRAAIYAAPALYEPFGLSILEAALSGCALVLSDIPTLREIWGNVATFVAPNDSGAWRAALIDLIRHSDKRKESAAHAQCRAIQFNPHRFGEEYMGLYRDVLAARRRPQDARRTTKTRNANSLAATVSA